MTHQRDHGENCDCIGILNCHLAPRNTRLAMSIIFDTSGMLVARPTIQTEQVVKGRGMAKAVAVTPSHCPFCGTAYGELKDEAQETDDTSRDVHDGQRQVEGS